MRLLIVEDDAPLASGLQRILEAEGHAVDVTPRGEDAVMAASHEKFDLVILDIGLPQMDGFEVLRRLRAGSGGGPMPVLVLTARDAVDDRVRGLDLGADDYMVKPFAFAELLARVRALVRRGRGAESPRLAAGDLDVDLITRKVTRAARPVELTVREFELLEYLLRHQGQVVSRETLARDVWKETARSTPLDNVIDVHIARLRRKVDAEYPVKLIHTVRGVGFMLREGEP
jgi:two-component system, OmpR family, copper resistance phosphate regulon response regulator CusR